MITTYVQVACEGPDCGAVANRKADGNAPGRVLAAALRSIERREGWQLAKKGRLRRNRKSKNLCPACLAAADRPFTLGDLASATLEPYEELGKVPADTAAPPRQ